MNNETKYFFMKFKIDQEVDQMASLFVSEDRNTIDQWQGPSGGKEEQNEKAAIDQKADSKKNPFEVVIDDYERSSETFRCTAPFVMRSLPVMRRIADDMKIRKFARRVGEKMEDGQFETYKISSDHLPMINDFLENSHAIAEGIGNLPSLFLLGLVSSYDVFLSRLIRVMFEVRPELLFTSDRTVSTKEILKRNSIEDIRVGIIEKEIESVLRSSHADQIEWLEKKIGDFTEKRLSDMAEFHRALRTPKYADP